jgi:hypothetical protein
VDTAGLLAAWAAVDTAGLLAAWTAVVAAGLLAAWTAVVAAGFLPAWAEVDPAGLCVLESAAAIVEEAVTTMAGIERFIVGLEAATGGAEAGGAAAGGAAAGGAAAGSIVTDDLNWSVEETHDVPTHSSRRQRVLVRAAS